MQRIKARQQADEARRRALFAPMHGPRRGGPHFPAPGRMPPMPGIVGGDYDRLPVPMLGGGIGIGGLPAGFGPMGFNPGPVPAMGGGLPDMGGLFGPRGGGGLGPGSGVPRMGGGMPGAGGIPGMGGGMPGMGAGSSRPPGFGRRGGHGSFL